MVLAVLDAPGVVYTVAGVGALAAAVLPGLLRRRPMSTPMVCLGLGLVLFTLPLGLTAPDPLEHPEWTEHLTELGVIVSLMGAGLKLDRPVGWRSWSPTWRLLAITMPLTIAGTALLGWWMVGLAPAAAMLLGAVVAPTDPVLASDVQVGAPGEAEEEDPHDAEEDVRFSLTSEAGLNDALAFPFTNAAVAMALFGTNPANWLGEWLAVDVIYRLAVGLVVGYVGGKGLGRVVFGTKAGARLATTGEGFVALAATFLAYGVTELAGGYGFLAVFVTAVSLRHYEHGHAYHATLHDFAEQTERLLMIGVVVLLGGAVAGGVLEGLTLAGVGLVLLILLVVRPVSAWGALLGSGLPGGKRAVVAFFGIRGVGSLYYLSYALNVASFGQARALWAIVALLTVASILLHGATMSPVMHRVEPAE